MLENPQNISDADSESIRQLKETYPYFVPARYMDAAQKHKDEPYTPDMISVMQLYMGNWLLYCQFLQAAMGGEIVEMDAAALQKPKPQPKKEEAPVEEPEEDKPEPPVEEEDAPEPQETMAEAPVAEMPAEQPAAEVEEEEIIYVEPVVEEIEEEVFTPVNTAFVTGHSRIADTVQNSTAEEQPALKKPLQQAEKDENLIPPIYTEDYFLHQGLHVSNAIPEELNKGGGNLEMTREQSLMVVMSFSEWLMYYKKKKQQEQEDVQDQRTLKTMWQKEKLAAALEEENEEIPENVFEMAVNSISKEENLASESLAEVYVKQGRYDQAIEMYKKLSLRKPQKKAYFARKIEEILKEK